MLNTIPMTTSDGRTLHIERANTSHVQKLYAGIDADRAHLNNLVWVEKIDYAGVLRYVCDKLLSEDELWVIVVDGVPSGCLEFRPRNGAWEMGYWLTKEHSNKGYMKLAVMAGLMTLCMGDKVKAQIKEGNFRSASVLKHNAFSIVNRDDGWVFYERTI